MNRSNILQALATAALLVCLAAVSWAGFAGAFSYTATVLSDATSTFSIALDDEASYCKVRNLDASHDAQVKFVSAYPTGSATATGWLHIEHPAAGMPEAFSELDSRDYGMDIVDAVYIRTDQTGYQNEVDVTAFCPYADN